MDKKTEICIAVSFAQGEFHGKLRKLADVYGLEVSDKALFNAINIAGDILLNQLEEKKEVDKTTLLEMKDLIAKHCMVTKCEHCPLRDVKDCGISVDEEQTIRNYTKLRDSGSFETDRELSTEEKIKEIENHCHRATDCFSCPLLDKRYCYDEENMTEEEINDNYTLLLEKGCING